MKLISQVESLMENQDLFEMANAYQEDTGLNGILYFSNKNEQSNKQAHALGRVKLYANGETYIVTIKPQKNGGHWIAGKKDKTYRRLEKFVTLNSKLLWKYWDIDSLETIRLKGPTSKDIISKFKKLV